MIKVHCVCGAELDRPSSILLGPPDPAGKVLKRHLCFECAGKVNALLDPDGLRREVEALYGAPDRLIPSVKTRVQLMAEADIFERYGRAYVAEMMREHARDLDPDDSPTAYMVKVAGKPWRCDCGGNVLSKEGNIYTCSSCRTTYEGS